MVVQVVRLVQMGSDNHLKAAPPQFLRQLHANLMRHRRGTFPRRKGLVAVERHDALVLPVPLFDRHHF